MVRLQVTKKPTGEVANNSLAERKAPLFKFHLKFDDKLADWMNFFASLIGIAKPIPIFEMLLSGL